MRGEPAPPAHPAAGLVWSALARQLDEPGTESEWIAVTDVDRSRFATHPWALNWSADGDLLAALDSESQLGGVAARIGYGGATGADDVFIAPAEAFRRQSLETPPIAPVITGAGLRDWTSTSESSAFFPGKDAERVGDLRDYPRHLRRLWRLWPYRTMLRTRSYFAGQTHDAAGRAWYGWHQVAASTGMRRPLIAFAWIATHGHFALLAGESISLPSAPVIELRNGADESDHLALLGVLNSSTACFWLKQHSHARGAPGPDQLRAGEPWELVHEFTATTLGRLPLPHSLPLSSSHELDGLARQLVAVEPSAICAQGIPSRERLDTARAEYRRIRGWMVALQEELDWDVYHRYGLLDEGEATEIVASPEMVPGLKLGERAFEIVMARLMAAGKLDTQWFSRHGSTPVTEVPREWPEEYRRVVERRIEQISRHRNIGLIERPEYKRRWSSEPWETREQRALTAWLLDRCEDRALWFGPDDQPRPMTILRLADRLLRDSDVAQVARLLAGPGTDLVDALSGALAGEHVPYLAQFRYKGEGLLKRTLWEQTWDLQRQEDKTGQRLDIPVPPKYTSADFHRQSFWRHRGKLDVPKERFISYPGASPDSDPSLLLGWAGWDHREQAAALITLIEDRTNTDGWDTDKLTPLIAGLAEVMPWVRQWHNDVDPAFGQSPADAYDAYLTTQRETRHLTDEALHGWVAPRPRRGRPPKSRSTRSGERP